MMAGVQTQAELLTLFPHQTLPTAAHGRSRHKGRKTKNAHGRGRTHHTHHARAKIDKAARADVWKHVGQARGQG